MNDGLTFESKIKRIEEIINILDEGELQLEDLLKHYEEGIKLTSECKSFLNNAELKIIEISKNYSSES